jgi:hypothetical protein
MKHLLIVFTLLFIFQNSFSQDNRRTRYVNQNDEEITKAQFDSVNRREVYLKKYKSDTLITHKFIYRKNYGELNTIQQKQINQLLTNILGDNFDNNKFTIIHLFDENDKALKKGIKNKKYWNWIERNSNKFQAYLIVSEALGIKKNEKKQLYIDVANKIKSVFFHNSEFKINHVFIQPNGEITVFYGNDDILYVLDSSV